MMPPPMTWLTGPSYRWTASVRLLQPEVRGHHRLSEHPVRAQSVPPPMEAWPGSRTPGEALKPLTLLLVEEALYLVHQLHSVLLKSDGVSALANHHMPLVRRVDKSGEHFLRHV